MNWSAARDMMNVIQIGAYYSVDIDSPSKYFITALARCGLALSSMKIDFATRL
jgi:hypothetical protein